MVKQLPIPYHCMLLGIILLLWLIDPLLPLPSKQALYASALSIKTVLLFSLPFMIFGLLFKAMVGLAHQGSKLIVLILILVCCSNFSATFLSHFIGTWVYHTDFTLPLPQIGIDPLLPLWSFTLPVLLRNESALITGIVLGIIGSYGWPLQTMAIAKKIEHMVQQLLHLFLLLIPLFISGFIVKMLHEGILVYSIQQYGKIFAWITLAQWSYLLLFYWLLHHGQWQSVVHHLRRMVPAALSGFSTMSSAAALPLLLLGSEKSLHRPTLAHTVIPVTVNIHLLGDCFAIPILAYALLKTSALPEPTLLQYAMFTTYFVMAKFSVAAVPGGGILVMLPLLERYFGFTGPMLSLITTLYLLFDPVITSSNILGNGAFAKLIDRCLEKSATTL